MRLSKPTRSQAAAAVVGTAGVGAAAYLAKRHLNSRATLPKPQPIQQNAELWNSTPAHDSAGLRSSAETATTASIPLQAVRLPTINAQEVPILLQNFNPPIQFTNVNGGVVQFKKGANSSNRDSDTYTIKIKRSADDTMKIGSSTLYVPHNATESVYFKRLDNKQSDTYEGFKSVPVRDADSNLDWYKNTAFYTESNFPTPDFVNIDVPFVDLC